MRRALDSILLALGTWVLLNAGQVTPSQARSPHLPSERQLDEQLSGVKHRPDDRGYQAHSTESTMSKARQAAAWVRQRLSGLHVTPARLGVGLGVLGVLVSWNRNKRHVKWAVVTGLSWLLLVFGAAAMIFHWPYLN